MTTTFDIPFTQHLMPDGRKSAVTIEIDEPTYRKAMQIIDAGFVFEVELLSDYRTMSATITEPRLGDAAICTAENGPDVPVKIKAMIERFDPQTAIAKLAAAQ